MEKCKKNKLMVVVGAGASIELGMPSVAYIDDLFSRWAKDGYTLANDDNKSLYCHIRDEINRHYSRNPKQGLRKETNFEEVLYVMLQLSASLGDSNYSFPINAFFDLKSLPKINSFEGERLINGNDLWNLSSILVDNLASEVRDRCKMSKNRYPDQFSHFERFIKQLVDDFDVAFITLNYDNLITQAYPDLFTGFSQSTGAFDAASIYQRANWGLIYHMHGSVHFDMPIESSDMYAIRWNPDLNSKFSGSSLGTSSQNTSEGIGFPTSTIIAGYGKTNQIQRVPFRTYYSQIDEIVFSADGFLFLGYGFDDRHLNNSLHSIRRSTPNKPVVVVDWASDNQDPMEFRCDR